MSVGFQNPGHRSITAARFPDPLGSRTVRSSASVTQAGVG
jgi:hypothetical protein